MSFFRRFVNAIGTGGGSEVSRMFGGGGARRSRPNRVLQEWMQLGYDPAAFEEAGGTNNPNNPHDPRYSDTGFDGVFDEFGFTRGLPGSHIAPDVQLRANRIAMRRNDSLVQQGQSAATTVLNSGLENLQSYRPGGAEALLSPYYQSIAQIEFQGALERRADAPDLMFNYDKQQRKSAEKAAERAGYIGAIGQLAGTVLGGLAGGAIAGRPSSAGGSGPLVPGGEGVQTFAGGQAGQLVPGGGRFTPLQAGQSVVGAFAAQAGQLLPGGGGGKGIAPGGGPVPGGPAPGGPGGGPAPGGGGGGGGQPQGAPGGGGGGTFGPPVGPIGMPATTAMATRFGVDPSILQAVLRRTSLRNPNIANEYSGRFALLLGSEVS